MEKVSVKNIGVWFIDQMTHPKTFFQRKSWGVFSVFAHCRRSDHRPKQAYTTKEKAASVAKEMGIKNGGSYSIYKCVYCDGWHVAKESGPEERKEKQNEIGYFVPTSMTLDVKKILATNIPDIHPVYGGVRGRTLSSNKQTYAWPTMIEAGIHTIIDLREDGVYCRMQDLCKRFGTRYVYYPVDKSGKLIDDMIEHFQMLCNTIDEGNFYIACAMGLHRTDIALCTYWVFYAADKGIAPPNIYGYREESGHNTGNIMRVLNAFYKRMVERTGKEPLPMDLFIKRKKIIQQLGMER